MGQEKNLKNNITNAFRQIQRQSPGARFFKADLHFHTPASEDARGSNKYNFNPFKLTFPARGKDENQYLQQIEKIQHSIREDCRKVARSIADTFKERGIRLVAVTDHNSIGTIWNDPDSTKKNMDLTAPTWYELIDDEAQKINREAGKTLLTILPGVEISTSDIHVLAVFPPQEPRRAIHFIICELLNEAGFAIDEWGKNPKAGKTGVYDTIELVVDRGGLPVIAHVDANEKALLKLYELKGAAMKQVLGNKHLQAIEIVNTNTYSKVNREVKLPLSQWFHQIRDRAGLPSFAYFQGSDAHCTDDIAKRATYVKMTTPSFSGLKTAVHIPSSRVRLAEMLEKKQRDGLFLHGMEIENTFFQGSVVHFNYHLNCVVGKKESGKSYLFRLLQDTVAPGSGGDVPGGGTVRLFLKKIADGQTARYVVGNDNGNRYIFALDPAGNPLERISTDQMDSLNLRPRFYRPRKVDELIASEEKFNAFLAKRFGRPTTENIDAFNNMFAITHFLEETPYPLLQAENQGGRYRLVLDTNWGEKKARPVEFARLDNSRKRLVLCLAIIIGGTGGKGGPLIMDAPEDHFDNDDIVRFLVPIIKIYKDFRQVLIFSNHPLAAINTDPENYLLLDRSEKNGTASIHSGFAIDDDRYRDALVNILEGSAGAFNKRRLRYGLDT